MFQFFRKIYNFCIIIKLIYKKGIESFLRDPLTGLYNRRLLKEFGEREIKRAERYKRHLYCIMIDLDGLKIINDGKGHSAGDEALKIVAKILKKNYRETDLVFRYGGDKFLILMPETFKIGVKMFSERVEDELKGFSLSVSIGNYFWKKSMTLDYLIEKADENLYKAKKKKPEEI